jgi:hypothetical protein
LTVNGTECRHPAMGRVRAAVLLVAAGPIAVAVLRNLPTRVESGPDGLTVSVASWAATAVAAYLLLCVGFVALRQLLAPSPAGQIRALAGTPAWLRRLLATLLGATVIAAASTSTASADELRGRPQPAPTLGWPITHDTDRDSSVVVVGTGDTLWSIAADALGGQADTDEVAAAWPQWWHANRDVIGPDPGRLTPGQHLVEPTGRLSINPRSPR